MATVNYLIYTNCTVSDQEIRFFEKKMIKCDALYQETCMTKDMMVCTEKYGVDLDGLLKKENLKM